MPTECSMRALLAHEPPPVFDEEPEAHAARMHPDPVATVNERRELEAKLAAQLREEPRR